jgi:probable HAF family extracellular repeat protein
MEVLYSQCCGLDVHKASVSACVLVREGARTNKAYGRFGTMTHDLNELARWLRELGVTHVAMEVIGFNEAGHVVGKADLAGPLPQLHHAFLASTGEIIDLGTQDGGPCSIAFAINSNDWVVGASSDCFNSLHAFLWEHGQMIDLNAFVPGSSNLTLTEATFINGSGEISAQGVFPNGDQHAVLLIPCDENHPNIEGCDYSPFDPATAAKPVAQKPATANQAFPEIRMKNNPMARRSAGHLFPLNRSGIAEPHQ